MGVQDILGTGMPHQAATSNYICTFLDIFYLSVYIYVCIFVYLT